MDENHLLNLNVRKTIRCLQGILEPNELEKIDKALAANVRQFLTLANSHLRFARRAEGPASWRQRVSRAYYACYAASRAVRLGVFARYSQETDDHKRAGDLPKDFPDLERWQDVLIKLRGDRNLADYDHTATQRTLENTSADYVRMTGEFLAASRDYLRAKGKLP